MYQLLLAGLSIAAMATEEANVQAQPGGNKPLWEIGVFTGIARIPHYPGSDEYDFYAIPFPYFIYRGRRLQADRNGLRGIFLRTEHFECNVSLFGNPPVTEDNKAREGMLERDPILELGPAAEWHPFGRSPFLKRFVKLALRGVASVDVDGDWSVGYEGLHAIVSANYKDNALFGNQDWRLGCSVGMNFYDGEFAGFYYDVPEAFATSNREAFRADGGYGGLWVSGNVAWRVRENIYLAILGSWRNLDSASFEDSPLVREKDHLIVGGAFVWRIARSRKSAQADVEEDF